MTRQSVVRTAFIFFVALQCIGALTLIAAFYISLWPLDLLVSFTRVLVLLLLVSLILSACIAFLGKYQKNRVLLGTLVGSCVLGLFVLFFSLTTHGAIKFESDTAGTVSFATFNKFYGNKDTETIAGFFNEQNVDIIALQETQPEEVAFIADRLDFYYTHSPLQVSTGNRAVSAVLSRYPIADADTVDLTDGVSAVRAEVETSEDENTVVYSVHLPGPFSNTWYQMRNRSFGALAQKINEEQLPVIVGGDFNTTVFSPALRKFNKAVRPVMQPVLGKKWPRCSWYGFGSAACLRIDHIFISNNMQPRDFTIAPDLGSDHRVLLVRLNSN